jgi:uncharacterized phage-associated protein
MSILLSLSTNSSADTLPIYSQPESYNTPSGYAQQEKVSILAEVMFAVFDYSALDDETVTHKELSDPWESLNEKK